MAGQHPGARLWVDERLQRPGRPSRKVHLDFHNTPHVGTVGDEFDAAEFTTTLRAAHVDSIVVFAKDMHGWCYWPAARAEAVHPGLTRDLLGEQVAACRDAGITVFAYYCAFWDDEFARTHPEWRSVRRDGSTWSPAVDEPPGWTALCLRSGAVDVVLADTRDLLGRYPVDGMWFDMPVPRDGACYCDTCLRTLRAEGLDPLDPAVQRADKQRLWVDWQRRSHALVQEVRPGCQVDQNNNTRLGLGERVPHLSNVDIEALPTGGWGYHYYPVDVRYARSFGVPVTGMTGRFVRSWADFGGLKPPEQLVVEVGRIAAQGAQVCTGDQARPGGRLDPAVYRTLAPAYALLEELAPHLDGAAPVVEAAVLVVGDPVLDPARPPGQVSAEPSLDWDHGTVGAADLLVEHRVQFDVVEPSALGDDLSRYRLLVVPDRTVVDPGLARRLLAHLDRGGAVITAGSGVRTTEGPPWVPGVVDEGRSPSGTTYLVEDPTDPDSFSHALYSGSERFLVQDPTALVLARTAEPLFERTGEHYTSHGVAPASAAGPHAAVWTQGRLGAFGFDVGTDFLDTGHRICSDLFGRVLDAVLPERVLRTDAPSPVEVGVTRQRLADGAERTLVHLVPAFTARRWGGRPDAYTAQPVLTDVAFSLGADVVPPGTPARLVRAGADVPSRSVGGRTEVVVPRLDGWEIIAFDTPVEPTAGGNP